VRCPRCGNENSEQNRFCGMCGATLLVPAPPPKPTPPAPTPIRQEPPPARAPEPAQSATPGFTADVSPSISGPSFLGLDSPPRGDDPRKRASLSIDPHRAPRSGNLDYLLEDDEPRSSGAFKYILILVALALAVGFGYLRWKNQGFAWLSQIKKPSGTASEPASGDSSAAPATSPSITPDTQPAGPQPAPSNPPATADSTTPASSTQANPPAGTAPAANPATSAPAGGDAAKPPDTTKSVPNGDQTTPVPSKNSSATNPADSDSTSDDDNTSQPAAAPKPVPKPKAAIPVAPADPVTEARKYLYGKGAPQDCDRGLRLLKPAANQANARAMVEMGALYSAGLCTPHDLPTAYRWFAKALHKEPDNAEIQADLQKLWSEMTQPERQLAIKMSQ